MKSGLIITVILVLLILILSYDIKPKKSLSRFILNNEKRLCPVDLHLVNYRTNLPMRYYYHTIMPGNYNWMFSSSAIEGGNVRASVGSKQL